MDLVVTPGLDPAHDVLHYGRQPLDAIFAPGVLPSSAQLKPRQCRAHDRLEFDQQFLWRDHLSRQPEAPEHSRHQSLSQPAAVPELVDLIVVVTPAKTIPGHHQGGG
jgi:acetyltransferase